MQPLMIDRANSFPPTGSNSRSGSSSNLLDSPNLLQKIQKQEELIQHLTTQLKAQVEPAHQADYPRRVQPVQSVQLPKYSLQHQVRRVACEILNKLTWQNLDKLVEQWLGGAVPISTPQILKGVVEDIVTTALRQPLFTSLYAKFCECISIDSRMQELPAALNSRHSPMPTSFRASLLAHCQDVFRDTPRGNIIPFIGELVKLRLVGLDVAVHIVQEMLDVVLQRAFAGEPVGSERVKNLCVLAATAGKMLDPMTTEPWLSIRKDEFDPAFDAIRQLSSNEYTYRERKIELTVQNQVMLEQLVYQRRQQWSAPAGEQHVPQSKTVDEVRAEIRAEEEARQAMTDALPRRPLLHRSKRSMHADPIARNPSFSSEEWNLMHDLLHQAGEPFKQSKPTTQPGSGDFRHCLYRVATAMNKIQEYYGDLMQDVILSEAGIVVECTVQFLLEDRWAGQPPFMHRVDQTVPAFFGADVQKWNDFRLLVNNVWDLRKYSAHYLTPDINPIEKPQIVENIFRLCEFLIDFQQMKITRAKAQQQLAQAQAVYIKGSGGFDGVYYADGRQQDWPRFRAKNMADKLCLFRAMATGSWVVGEAFDEATVFSGNHAYVNALDGPIPTDGSVWKLCTPDETVDLSDLSISLLTSEEETHMAELAHTGIALIAEGTPWNGIYEPCSASEAVSAGFGALELPNGLPAVFKKTGLSTDSSCLAALGYPGPNVWVLVSLLCRHEPLLLHIPSTEFSLPLGVHEWKASLQAGKEQAGIVITTDRARSDRARQAQEIDRKIECLFASFDADGNGVLSNVEFGQYLDCIAQIKERVPTDCTTDSWLVTDGRWDQLCEACACQPIDGIDLNAFRRFYLLHDDNSAWFPHRYAISLDAESSSSSDDEEDHPPDAPLTEPAIRGRVLNILRQGGHYDYETAIDIVNLGQMYKSNHHMALKLDLARATGQNSIKLPQWLQSFCTLFEERMGVPPGSNPSRWWCWIQELGT